MRAKLIALLGGLATACGSHTGSHDVATATLSVDPPTSQLMILNGTPGTESFTATLTFEDNTKQDVTADTTFSIDSTFGAFAGNALSMMTAGKTAVTASYVDKTASAEVIGLVKDIIVQTGTCSASATTQCVSDSDCTAVSGGTCVGAVSPMAPTWFTMPEDPSRAPKIAYPAVGVIMPPNPGDFDVHWVDSAGNDTFEVSLTTEFSDVRMYVPGGNGSIAGGGYTTFLADEWSAAVGTSTTVTFQVRGVLSTNPVSVGSAPPQLVKLSNDAMLGGIYYWASTGTYGIYRHDMSQPDQQAQQYITTAQVNRCVACHVLSRDGKEMLVTYDGGGDTATTVDVATATAAASGGSWNFATFTPDDTEFLAVESGTLTVRSYATQAVLATMTAAGAVSHPDLSPDGTKLVYVRPQVAGSDWAFGTGQIWMRTFDQSTNTFGPEQQLVADAANNYYPSFSPDNKWILFNKGDNTQNGNENMSYNGPNAELWVMPADNSAPPIQLATANISAGLTDSWGRWAPFAQTFGPDSEQMYWITVSSKRDFGVRLVGTLRPQIWMTAFFPDLATQAQDPSAPAFRLPFQDITSDNHIAQWAQAVIQ
ncbi:MAG TPA: hypothetical protein VMJ10_15280 [Kofleriaceae bacterium]|nr:hypothetical protein [Kofleriaceae bacterium]